MLMTVLVPIAFSGRTMSTRGSLEALRDGVVTEKADVEEFHEQMYKESLFLQERFWEAVLKVYMIYLITADIQIPFRYAKNTIFSQV